MKRQLKMAILLPSLLLCLNLTGCTRTTIQLSPIMGNDLIRMKQGTSLTAEKNGYFVSDKYMIDIFKAKEDMIK